MIDEFFTCPEHGKYHGYQTTRCSHPGCYYHAPRPLTDQEKKVIELQKCILKLKEALSNIENDCGCIPAPIWEARNDAIKTAEAMQ